MSVVYLNGQFVSPEQAVVSLFDFGYLYGDGLFETLRAYDGFLFQLDAHLDRFFESADHVMIEPPHDRNELSALCRETLKRGGNPDGAIRITLSRGVGTAGLDPNGCQAPTLAIASRAYTPAPDSTYRDGIDATWIASRRVPRPGGGLRVKGQGYQDHVVAQFEVAERKAREGLLLNQEGALCEGTVSNVFLVRDGSLSTPSLDSGCLAGITRGIVLELAREAGIPTTETELLPADLQAADECFFTNSLFELLPVARVDQKPIGAGRPGPIALRLLTDYRRRIDSEARAA